MRRREDGFTLLESLIAFAIAAVALAAAFGALRSGTAQERRAETALSRTLEAWSLMEEAIAAPGAAPQAGRFAVGGEWRIEIAPAGAATDARLVTLVATEGGRETLRLTSVTLAP